MADEETRTTSPTGGQKGVKDARYDLIPPEALEQLAKLYGFGAGKYDDHNWRNGYDWSKSYAALQRHANQFWAGQDNDEETGLPHMASVAWHAFTLLVFMQDHPLYDDRFKPGDGAVVQHEVEFFDQLAEHNREAFKREVTNELAKLERPKICPTNICEQSNGHRGPCGPVVEDTKLDPVVHN